MPRGTRKTPATPGTSSTRSTASTRRTRRTAGTPATSSTSATPGTPPAPGTPSTPSTPGTPATALASAPMIPAAGPTGDDILALALKHEGEEYVLGARAPMSDANWKGPWDCAEFCSWCVFQVTGVLYGVRPANDPVRADAFTGFWADDAAARGHAIPVEEAVSIPGACLLRKPRTGRVGHIVFSDGKGGTMEAHSTARGLIRHVATGVLVPGVRYFANEDPVDLGPAPRVLRVTDPMMRGPRVKAVQKALKENGYPVGDVDGIYGPQTEAAVLDFQADKGLVPDGEVGPDTEAALGV